MRKILVALMFTIGCSNSPTQTPQDLAGGPADLGTAPDLALNAIIAARPYDLHVPTGYDPTKATPLVILLHGYGATGAIYNAYFGLFALSDEKTFLYAAPDGTVDSMGKRFWDATDACCNLYGMPEDDVGYLDAIIDDVAARYNLDAKRVFVVGHSNGGFMAHRFACDMAPRVAAIVSLAGAQWLDATKCMPSEKVSVVQIHGDADTTIKYTGDTFYPSAHVTVADWATKNGCTGSLTDTGTTLDLETMLAGAETKVERYAGCTGSDVELWTIQGGMHVPMLATPAFPEAVWTFLAAHPKP